MISSFFRISKNLLNIIKVIEFFHTFNALACFHVDIFWAASKVLSEYQRTFTSKANHVENSV